MTTTTFGFTAGSLTPRPERAALRPRQHDELIAEHPWKVPRDRRVDRVRHRHPALVPALRQHLVERRGRRRETLDDEPGVVEQRPERARREEPEVRVVEDPPVEVVE